MLQAPLAFSLPHPAQNAHPNTTLPAPDSTLALVHNPNCVLRNVQFTEIISASALILVLALPVTYELDLESWSPSPQSRVGTGRAGSFLRQHQDWLSLFVRVGDLDVQGLHHQFFEANGWPLNFNISFSFVTRNSSVEKSPT